MKHLFVPYETALELKNKGFDEPCFAHWGESATLFIITPEPEKNTNSAWNKVKLFENCTVPLFQQVVDWLREKHFLHITLKHKPSSQTYGFVISGKYEEIDGGKLVDKTFDKFEYYEALNKAIKEALKLI